MSYWHEGDTSGDGRFWENRDSHRNFSQNVPAKYGGGVLKPHQGYGQIHFGEINRDYDDFGTENWVRIDPADSNNVWESLGRLEEKTSYHYPPLPAERKVPPRVSFGAVTPNKAGPEFCKPPCPEWGQVSFLQRQHRSSQHRSSSANGRDERNDLNKKIDMAEMTGMAMVSITSHGSSRKEVSKTRHQGSMEQRRPKWHAIHMETLATATKGLTPTQESMGVRKVRLADKHMQKELMQKLMYTNSHSESLDPDQQHFLGPVRSRHGCRSGAFPTKCGAPWN